MARKFSTQNTNKLLTRLVILASVLSLAYFAYLLTQDSEVNRIYSDRVATCGTGQEWCYAICHNYLANFRAAQQWSAIIGVGFPILFFGGKALLNYIVPEQNK